MEARAWLLGLRIDARAARAYPAAAVAPLTVRVGDSGHAIVFRFGAVVTFDVGEAAASAFLESLADTVAGRLERPETETVEVVIDPHQPERIGSDGRIVLHSAGTERLQVVGQILAKSVVLAHYEVRVASVFDRVEELAEQLKRGARPAKGRELLREIGDVLLIQARTVGRVEVTEKPEIVWEHPDLDRLYERLAVEFELRDRDLALSRKLDLIANTAETYLDLLQTRQSIRVEWYIVVLIVVEILLSLYGIFVAH